MTAREISRPHGAHIRTVALLTHRYVGLFIALFLAVAGVTGTLLAFYEELDHLIVPGFYDIPALERHLPNLDPFRVAERVDAQLPPGRHCRTVHFAVEEGQASRSWFESQPGRWQELFVSPKSGKVQGARYWGEISDGRQNLMPFIYRLHYSLGLGEVGTALFGVVALLWTLDCFVAAYLTFPSRPPEGTLRASKLLRRWLPAWGLRTGKLSSLVFTWHRASGLWLWASLLIFAWSGVGFNLPGLYQPLMRTLVGMQASGHEALPQLLPPFPEPQLSLREAHARGRAEMARLSSEKHFSIRRELELYYAEDHGAFGYAVESSLDISGRKPRTEVYLDGQTGKFLGFFAPTAKTPGNTISSWLVALHTASAFGTWYRALVALIGVGVAGLSLTGVWIWWRKRTKAARARAGAAPTKLTPPKEFRP